jgi:hypothetical protein
VVCLLAAALTAQAAGLRIVVENGAGAVEPAGAASGRSFVVRVLDASGQPASGAAVTFLLPANGPSGLFASGMRIETFPAGADGRAAVRGIQWNGQAGECVLRVSASLGGERSEAEIVVRLDPQAKNAREISRGIHHRPRGKLYLTLAGAGAIGALVALRGAGGGGAPGPAGAPPPMVQPPVTPSLSAPSIQIGKP